MNNKHRAHALPLLVAFGLCTSLSHAAPPAKTTPARTRSGATNQAPQRQAPPGRSAANAKPPRKQLQLSPAVRERLARPTVERKPLRYQPLSKQEVRKAIDADARPPRAGTNKPASNTQLTAGLNDLEKRINGYGLSLRDPGTVIIRDHEPDRARLDKQVEAAERVLKKKPPRALSSKDLRDQVRARSKTRRTRSHAPVRSNLNQALAPAKVQPLVAASFEWNPIYGETDTAAAFLETRADFSGQLQGFDASLDGNVAVSAGGHLLGERFELVRIDGDFSVHVDGDRQAKIVATYAGGWQETLLDETHEDKLTKGGTLTLFEQEQNYDTPLFIVGIPVTIEVTLSPSMTVDYEVALDDGQLYGHVEPSLTLDATIEAYVDYWLVEAGVGGTAKVLEVRPELTGLAYVNGDGQDGQDQVLAMIGGQVDVNFLQGRAYTFLEIGFWPFEKRVEWELFEYPGYSETIPVFDFNGAWK